MALKLEFCSVIVRVATIRQRLGDEAFESWYATATDTTWHDGHLFRDGCMSPYELEEMLDEWEVAGFELLSVVDGEKRWKDVCVVHSGHGPSYPCEWVEYDAAENVVWLKGRERGEAVGPPGRAVAGEE